MLARLVRWTLIGTALALLVTACQNMPGTTALEIHATPYGARVTVVSDLDGAVLHDGFGDVVLTDIDPGPYVVFIGEGADMIVDFVTLPYGLTAHSPRSLFLAARGGGGGGGGHTETAGNNLSFPVVFADGTIALNGTFDAPVLTVPYDLDGDGTITEADMIDTYYQFAQKTEGNVWQAESATPEGIVYVNEIDWGDSMESVDMKLGRPVRVELSLYKILAETFGSEAVLPTSMDQFAMEMLSNPSSKDEVQGVGATEAYVDGDPTKAHILAGTEATVYTDQYGLVIQPLIGTRDQMAEGVLAWNGSQWIDPNGEDELGVEAPIDGIVFSSELNVGGKVIFGLSQGGWRPRAVGDYRITFFVQPTADTQLDFADIRVAIEEAAPLPEPLAEEGDAGGTGIVVTGTDSVTGADCNLTYIDVRVVGGGGGGGGKPTR